MPVALERRGIRHRAPALARRSASRRRRSRMPAAAAAVISPTEWPAMPPIRSRRPSASRRPSVRRPAATMSGWATAVSRMVSASVTVPWATRSTPAASRVARRAARRTAGSASQGSRNPGVCEPCPGQTTTITLSSLPTTAGASVCRCHKHLVESLVRADMPRSAMPVSRRRRGWRSWSLDRADDERRLQDERLARARGIPADDLGDALEAVAHGVRVHEQLAGGRLERAAVVEVAPQGGEQLGRVRLQRAVDAVDEGRAGERVAREGALGQQVVGVHGSRGVAPRARATAKPARAAFALFEASTRFGTSWPSTRCPAPKCGSSCVAISMKVSAADGADRLLGSLPSGSDAPDHEHEAAALHADEHVGVQVPGGAAQLVDVEHASGRVPTSTRPRRGRASRARRCGSAARRRTRRRGSSRRRAPRGGRPRVRAPRRRGRRRRRRRRRSRASRAGSPRAAARRRP